MSHRASAERYLLRPLCPISVMPGPGPMTLSLKSDSSELLGSRISSRGTAFTSSTVCGAKMTDMPAADAETRAEPYLSGFGFEEYLDHLRHRHPDLYERLSPGRC